MRAGSLGEFLAEAGAVVGGGAALFATLGFIAGSLVRELDPNADPHVWARRGGLLGGAFGLVIFLDGA